MVGGLYIATTSTYALYAVAPSLISTAVIHITCTSPVRQGEALSCSTADGARTKIAVYATNAGSNMALYIVTPSQIASSSFAVVDLIAN